MSMKSSVTANTAQMTFTLDIPEVLSKIDKFSKEQFVSTFYPFCGRKLSVHFYPKGCTDSTSTSICVALSKEDKPEIVGTTGRGTVPLKMEVNLQCGHTMATNSRQRMIYPVTEYEQEHCGVGMGLNNFHTLDYLKNNPTLTITAIMHFTDASIVPPEHDFSTQCQAMHNCSEREGDMLLQVISGTTPNEDELTAPPLKKRRLCEESKVASVAEIGSQSSSLGEDKRDEEVWAKTNGMKAIIEFAEKNRANIIKNDRCHELPFCFQTGVLKIFQ